MPSDIAEIIENPEIFEELIFEHISNLTDPIAHQLADLTGTELETVKESFEKSIKKGIELQEELSDNQISNGVQTLWIKSLELSTVCQA